MTTAAIHSMLMSIPDLGAFKLAVLIVLLLLAAAIDLRTLRIPNWLTIGGALAGLALNTIDSLRPMSAFLVAFGGLAVGLLILLPLYALRVMGAGDVKLMAMTGAFLGWPDILFAVLFSLIAGGAAALAFAIYRRAVGRLAGNVAHIVQFMAFAATAGLRGSPMAGRESVGRLPYGACTAIGTTAWLFLRLLGYV